MDDRQLIDGVLRGDPAAERALYDAHVDRVFRLAYRMTGDEMMAQDFTQETFVRSFSRLDSFRGEASLGTWLYAITMSVVLNGLRRRRRNREVDLVRAESLTAPVRESDPMLRRQLHRAIDALSDRLRAVFILHDVEGFKHHEIGAMLGIPVGTSKARLSRARDALRRQLRPWKPKEVR